MPTYVFRCTDCGFEFDQYTEYNEKEPECKRCSGRTKKRFTPPSIMLHGPGFYSTDNRKK